MKGRLPCVAERCRWRFLWTSGSGGHEQARGGDQAWPRDAAPLMAGPHQRRLDVLTIVATLAGLLFRYDTGDQRRPGPDVAGPRADPIPRGLRHQPPADRRRDRSGALRPDQRHPRPAAPPWRPSHIASTSPGHLVTLVRQLVTLQPKHLW